MACPGPAIAIICNSLPPYRVHLHYRFIREMQPLKIWTVVTHENRNGRWGYHPEADLNALLFGPGENSDRPMHPRYALREWRKGGRILRWMEAQNVQAVLLHGYNDPGRIRVLLSCHRKRIPCFLVGDSNIRSDTANPLKRVIKKLILRPLLLRTTGFMPCGSLGAAYFQRYSPGPQPAYYVPYEPDYDQIHRLGPEAIREVQARFGLQPQRRRIVFSGRFVSQKRANLALDAFFRLAADRPEWDLIMLGEGPLRTQLQQSVPEALRPRVIWTGFIGQQEVVSAIYRCSDVLVLPSDYEPWALVVNEAAAAGMAMVTTDVVGAAAELVKEKVNGRTFPPGDLPALIDCLLEVTAADRIDAMKAASAAALAEWRQRADPVEGLRQALRFAGVLPQTTAPHALDC